LSQFILPVPDQEHGGIVIEDRAWLTNAQWREQKQAIEKYIKPCYYHPNVNGHKEISQGLIKLIEESKQCL